MSWWYTSKETSIDTEGLFIIIPALNHTILAEMIRRLIFLSKGSFCWRLELHEVSRSSYLSVLKSNGLVFGNNLVRSGLVTLCEQTTEVLENSWLNQSSKARLHPHNNHHAWVPVRGNTFNISLSTLEFLTLAG